MGKSRALTRGTALVLFCLLIPQFISVAPARAASFASVGALDMSSDAYGAGCDIAPPSYSAHRAKIRIPVSNRAPFLCFFYLQPDPEGDGFQGSKAKFIQEIQAGSRDFKGPVEIGADFLATGSLNIQGDETVKDTLKLDLRASNRWILSQYLFGNTLSTVDAADGALCRKAIDEQWGYVFISKILFPIIENKIGEKLPLSVQKSIRKRVMTVYLTQVVALGYAYEKEAGVGAQDLITSLVDTILADPKIIEMAGRKIGINKAATIALSTGMEVINQAISASNLSQMFGAMGMQGLLSPCRKDVVMEFADSCPTAKKVYSNAPKMMLSNFIPEIGSPSNRAIIWTLRDSAENKNSSCGAAVALSDQTLFPGAVVYQRGTKPLVTILNNGHITSLCWSKKWLVAAGGKNDPDHPVVLMIDTDSGKVTTYQEAAWSYKDTPWSDFWDRVTCDSKSATVRDTDYGVTKTYAFP